MVADAGGTKRPLFWEPDVGEGSVARPVWHAVPIGMVVGWQVRELRQERGWRQIDLARSLVAAGLRGWTQAAVANLERGDRKLDLEELLALGRAFGVPIVDLVPKPADGVPAPVRIGVRGEMHANIARAYLSGDRELPASETPGPHEPRTLFEYESDQTERKAAKALGLARDDADTLAKAAFGQSLPRMRDRQLLGAPDFADLDARSRQARRGHITRGLLAELRVILSALSRPVSAFDSFDEFREAVAAIKGEQR